MSENVESSMKTLYGILSVVKSIKRRQEELKNIEKNQHEEILKRLENIECRLDEKDYINYGVM